MTPIALTATLTELFGNAVQPTAANSYQIESPEFRLLVLLSDDQSWLRMLVPIAPIQAAQPFIERLLEANFDLTQETRYARHQDILWAVFQHGLAGLTIADFTQALQRLQLLKQQGVDEFFNALVVSAQEPVGSH